MRSSVIAYFGLFAVFAASALAAACASSEAPDVDAIIHDRNGTDPADAGDSADDDTETVPTPTKKSPQPTPIADSGAKPVDAGADAGKPGDDDDDNGGTDCPQTEAYSEAALLAVAMPGATMCPTGGGECSSDQCCVVNMFSNTANVCVPK